MIPNRKHKTRYLEAYYFVVFSVVWIATRRRAKVQAIEGADKQATRKDTEYFIGHEQ